MTQNRKKQKEPAAKILTFLDEVEMRIDDCEAFMEKALDTAELRLHLAKMESQDKLGALGQRLGRLQQKVHTALEKVDQGTGQVLAKFGETCTNLSERH